MQASTMTISYDDKNRFYAELRREIEALADPIWFTALANAAASLKQHLPRVNWAGFYLLRDGELVLGPFQGLPACTRIALGKGVCGTAFAQRKSLLVDDVEQFPGHIACDSASRSELVVPLFREDSLEPIGVLDLDSPDLARFDDADRTGIEHVAQTIMHANRWPASF